MARTLKPTNSLYAVDALPSGAVWAVGSYLGSRNGPWRTLIMAIPA